MELFNDIVHYYYYYNQVQLPVCHVTIYCIGKIYDYDYTFMIMCITLLFSIRCRKKVNLNMSVSNIDEDVLLDCTNDELDWNLSIDDSILNIPADNKDTRKANHVEIESFETSM